MQRQGERGQALIETAAFLPFMIALMAGVVYFGQFGVLQERATQGARYASLHSNAASGTNIFSIQEMYHELHREGKDTTDPGFPANALQCAASTVHSGTSATDEENVLTQSETLPNGTVGATAPPYFRPDNTTGSTCQAEKLDLVPSDPDVDSSYFVAQYTEVDATKHTPSLLRVALGLGLSGSVKAGMSYIRPAAADDIVYCSPNFAAAIAGALGPEEPVTQAGPFAGYHVPPVGVKHAC